MTRKRSDDSKIVDIDNAKKVYLENSRLKEYLEKIRDGIGN